MAVRSRDHEMPLRAGRGAVVMIRRSRVAGPGGTKRRRADLLRFAGPPPSPVESPAGRLFDSSGPVATRGLRGEGAAHGRCPNGRTPQSERRESPCIASARGRGSCQMPVLHRTVRHARAGCPSTGALRRSVTRLVPHHPAQPLAAARVDARRADVAVVYRGLLARAGSGRNRRCRAGLRRLDRRRDGPALCFRRPVASRAGRADEINRRPASSMAITGCVDAIPAPASGQAAFDRLYGAEPSVDQLEIMWDICREMSFRIALRSPTCQPDAVSFWRAVPAALGRRRQGHLVNPFDRAMG